MDTPTYPGTKSSRSTDEGDSRTLYTHFPAVPGEDPMPHQGAAWYEAAVGRLAGRLLRVANGLVPTDVEKIVDIDLTQIPQLPASHAHYERRLEARLRAERDNARNRTERQEIYIRDWTDLYKLMAEATEANAPLLHRAIHNACDMSHYTPPLPGFDGPRAWNMVLAAMLRTTNRSKSERQYYKVGSRRVCSVLGVE